MIRAFIQARVSSRRFPGKVLARLNGRPVISHVIERVQQAVPAKCITVATSTDPSDDPLAVLVRQMGISVYRGPLEDVFQRFRLCLQTHPCRWFFRVCADSPLLDVALFHSMLPYAQRSDLDLITNIFPRTFPRGLSLELIRSARFLEIDPQRLSADRREHVTQVYYDHPQEFRILNLESSDSSLADRTWALDTPEDLAALEGRP